jgi:3-mercaptopyruvate sulfurtransferase SseA
MKTKTSIFLALVAVLFTATFVWHEQRPTASVQITWKEVLQKADAGGYHLITTTELANRYTKDASSQLLIDTRQEWEYHTGHIEGALNFPMEPTWWSRWKKAGEIERFLGPDKDQFLVFY